MNRTELVASIAEKSGITKKDAEAVLSATLDSIAEALKKGDKVQIPGIITLAVEERAARKGINPATKQVITIPAKKVVKVKPGKELADAVK